MKRSEGKNKQDLLLKRVPPGASRVLVKTATGKKKYKDPALLAETDNIILNKDGVPIIMTTSPGRKKKIVVEPVNEAISELMRRKKELQDNDRILSVTKSDPESPDVLHQVVLALGEEAASIAFEREEAERQGTETSNLSVRRINALKALADPWLKRREQVVTRGVDMDTPGFRVLFSFIVTTMKEAMDPMGVKPEMTEAVFAKFSKMIDSEDWVTTAKNKMKGIV